MYLEKLGLLRRGDKVFHFGPEKAFAWRLREVVGDGYFPLDLYPQVYEPEGVKVLKFDLCEDLAREPDDSVDLIIANHILEHLPCAVERVIADFARVLKPQGNLILTVPMRSSAQTIEDMSNISSEERTRRFGQADHWRLFGNQDFPSMMKAVLAQDTVVRRLDHFRLEELQEAAVPIGDIARVDSNTIFHYRKPDREHPHGKKMLGSTV
jgi:predicted SAM-dependent methyltransferase